MRPEKQQISLIGSSSINQDEEKILHEISDPFLYRLAIGMAKRLRKSTKQKDDEIISPLLLLYSSMAMRTRCNSEKSRGEISFRTRGGTSTSPKIR